MTSSKYDVTVDQLEDNGSLHTNAHIFFIKIQEEQPGIIKMIMTQLSLNSGLIEWGTKPRNSVYSEMKQLHFRNTYKPIHWKELDHTQSMSVL